MAAAAVAVGAFVARSPVAWGPAVLGACSAFLAAAGANALNDSLDRDTDAVNRPDRPVPSGRISTRAALVTAVVAFVVSLVTAFALSGSALALAAGWVAVTALYSVSLKGVPLAGNVAVAAVASTPFLMGGLSQGRYVPALIPTALAFMVHLAREIVKDVEDIEGDSAAGIRTLAVASGADTAFAIARGVMIALIGVAAVPFALGIYGWGYAAVIVLIDVLLIRTMLAMSSGSETGRLEARSRGWPARPSSALKMVMALGLVAFAVGRL
jgi:geranylgeranylglycerol-phosphate geranylgeranyltransferase